MDSTTSSSVTDALTKTYPVASVTDISVTNTLAKAYSIIEKGGQSLAPETVCIQYMFLTPAHIAAFHDEDLYLEYIQNLITERFNVSFPEEKSAFDQYFSDCIQLKEQLESHRNFNKEQWLSYTSALLEALKTPYYSAYSATLLTLESCFSDASLFEKVQKAFYSVLIKSSEKKQVIIKKIIEHAPVYKQYSFITEELLSEILINTLALFGDEKEYWLTSLSSLLEESSQVASKDTLSLLSVFFRQEQEFLNNVSSEDSSFRRSLDSSSSDISSFATYLAHRTAWFYTNKNTIRTSETVSPSSSVSHIAKSYVDSEFLNTFAYNMTTRTYHANPAIGREQEISDLELILISPKKSPLLIGEAGVGKTSVVEGLAWRLQKGNVPELLKNKKIFKLTTTSLLSGTKYVGEMEDRIKKLAGELEAHPDVILFIDEIHTIVGAGSTESSNNDISNMLKPYIDRGDIKLIGATTKEEYRQFLLPDKALARRFYPIAIEEPDEELTLSILKGSIPSIEYETKVRNTFSADTTEKILRTLITISAPENQPEDQHTKRPELPLTLLEMAFSYAALNERSSLSAADIEQAVCHSNRLRKEVRANFSCIF